jgi:N-acetylglucosamine-6-sulfatase
MPSRRRFLTSATAAALTAAHSAGQTAKARPRNVVFILTDDHRYDAFGFLHPQTWLRTPQLDTLARDGVHLKNAFVTTALCSPSRASILTGLYAHRHKIVDNNTAIPRGTRFFPQLLQPAGYKTAFIGKWHMGNASDDPQPGFDKWVSFRGQGTYLPSANGLNVDGKHVPQKGYITDELTDYALDWLNTVPRDQPYFLYLSHKAVHSDFVPAQRHKGVYANETFRPPKTMAESGPNAQHRPMWVQNQRNSWHGVEFPYHSDLDISEYYKRYAETLLGVDESVGRVLDALKKRGQLDSTLLIYMGDNGFAFGEHGLIDKRTAYEESMRVPMLARCPEMFPGGRAVTEMVAGLDIMPTVLDAAGVPIPQGLDGRSMLPLLRGGRDPQWRTQLLYEYYWERNYPQTPTMHALRTDRYKYIHYYGIWDTDELYDMQEDPLETDNLIFNPERKDTIRDLNQRLFDEMERTDGMTIPLFRDSGERMDKRSGGKSRTADFPDELKVKKP